MAGQDVCGAAATALRVVRTGTNTLNKTLLPIATAIKHIHPRNVCVCVCVRVHVRVCTPHYTHPTHPGVNQRPVWQLYPHSLNQKQSKCPSTAS